MEYRITGMQDNDRVVGVASKGKEAEPRVRACRRAWLSTLVVRRSSLPNLDQDSDRPRLGSSQQQRVQISLLRAYVLQITSRRPPWIASARPQSPGISTFSSDLSHCSVTDDPSQALYDERHPLTWNPLAIRLSRTHPATPCLPVPRLQCFQQGHRPRP